MARIHLLALNKKAENQVYNAEGREKVSIRQVAETIQKILGGHIKIEYIPARPGDYRGKDVSAEKARRELGWEPKISFEEGMQRYIEWYKKHLGIK